MTWAMISGQRTETIHLAQRMPERLGYAEVMLSHREEWYSNRDSSTKGRFVIELGVSLDYLLSITFRCCRSLENQQNSIS